MSPRWTAPRRLSPAEIEHHMAEARRLRAEALGEALSALGRALRRPFGARRRRPERREPG